MPALRTRRLGLGLTAAAFIAMAGSAPASADTVTDWNTNAVNALVGTAAQSPTVSTVHLAIVHGAVYDAVNSIDERYEPYLVKVHARRWYSTDAAAATAAYRVLLGIIPSQQETDHRDPPSRRRRQRRHGGRPGLAASDRDARLSGSAVRPDSRELSDGRVAGDGVRSSRPVQRHEHQLEHDQELRKLLSRRGGGGRRTRLLGHSLPQGRRRRPRLG